MNKISHLFCWLLLTIFIAPGCTSTPTDAQKAQLIDNAAVASTYVQRAEARLVDKTLSDGTTIKVLDFGAALTGQDFVDYLKLNLRAWVAWNVIHGNMTKQQATDYLKPFGITPEFPKED